MATLMNPWLYIALALVIWQCYRLRAYHRRFWGVGLFLPQQLSMQQLVFGIATGAVLSGVFLFGGWDFALTTAHVWWVWGAVLLLGLVRLRFMGLNYAAGLVSLLVLISGWWAQDYKPMADAIYTSLQAIDVAPLLLFGGVLTAMGGMLTLWRGSMAYCPWLMPWRGKSVGAVVLQSLWAVPAVVHSAGGWLAFPVLLVYADVAVSRSPKEQARLSGVATFAFGLTVCGLAWASFYMDLFLWVGALWSLFGLEAVRKGMDQLQGRDTPLFQASVRGIRVLAVQQGGPAAEMGILPGDLITTVNGVAVKTMTDLYAALQKAPAFCKLEVIDQRGEQRYVQRSRYADEPHQLGIVPAQATPVSESGDFHRSGWWHLFIGETRYRRPVDEKPFFPHDF